MARRHRRYQTFFADLKRRGVFAAAALYGGVAFVVIQAADFMVPALHLSERVATTIALVAILGFPFSMVLAWIFDITPSGMSRTIPPDEGELEAIASQPLRRRWPAGILALLRDGPHCVCELAATFGARENNVSNHLAKLREAGLVRTSRHKVDARWVYYERDEDAVAAASEALSQVL